MTTSCRNCQRYTAIVRESDGANRLYNYASDGFTVTAGRHICGESDRRLS